MNPFDLVEAYAAAEKIMDKAESDTIYVHPVWQKVWRIKQYLRNQADAEFKEILA